MPDYDRTLLDETYKAVVQRQNRYGRERSFPWGISRAGYNKTDVSHYQYPRASASPTRSNADSPPTWSSHPINHHGL